MAMHLSLQSFPIDMKEPVFRLLRMWPCYECFDNWRERGIYDECVACMWFPSAALTDFPLVNMVTFLNI